MGVFDTLTLGGKTYQIKAFGAGMRDLTVGTEVRAAYLSETEGEYLLSRAHRYLVLPAAYSVEAVSERSTNRVVVAVTNGMITGLIDSPREVHFDSHGHSVGATTVLPVIEANPDWIRAREESSQIVKGLRARPRADAFVHVWRMTNDETSNFAASTVLVACVGDTETEARQRAGWAPISPSALHSPEYLGAMRKSDYYALTAAEARARTEGEQ